MTESELLKLLGAVRSGKVAPAGALAELKNLPFEDLDFAKVDHHRALRQGFAEVVFGKGKTAGQVAEIVKSLLGRKPGRQNVLVTRADAKMFAAVKRAAGRHRAQLRNSGQGHDCGGVRGDERHSRGGRGGADCAADG
jgi:pyridinium-3,5-biscarboxylic acid mononucleotide synthase